MLTIENFKKIKNQWFGDWQIGNVIEDMDMYAFKFVNKDGRDVTLVINRKPKNNFADESKKYEILLMSSSSSTISSNFIEDIIYIDVMADMELFGESVSHYLNSL